MQETVKLNDGTSVQINVRKLNTEQAFKVLEGLDINIEEKGGVTKIPIKSLSLIRLSVDFCVADFPQKGDIDPEDYIRIYETYARPTIEKLKGGTSPK
jgi:predicted DNA-binding antitoxin AbrB/MazE fold protein